MIDFLLCICALAQDPAPAPQAVPLVDHWLGKLDELARNDHRHGTFGPTGKRLWMTDLRAVPGMVGTAHYLQHTEGFVNPLAVTLRAADGTLVDPSCEAETWRPTHSEVRYTLPRGGRLAECRWIDSDDVFVSRLSFTGPCDLEVGFTSPFAERPTGDLRRFVPTQLLTLANVDVTRDPRLRIGAADAPIWIEGEQTTMQVGSTGPDKKRAASAGAVLGRDFGSKKDQRASWDFVATGQGAWKLHVRYARDAKQPARFLVDLRGAAIGILTLAPTGGWGEREQDFGVATVELGELPEGPSTLTLVAEHDHANANFDALVVAPKDFALPPAFLGMRALCAPALRGSVHLPPGGMQLAGVPFQFLPARRLQGLLTAEPILVTGAGALLHVLAIPTEGEAELAVGTTARRVGPRGLDAATWMHTLTVPASGDLQLVAKNAVILAITREAVVEGANSRAGEVRFHGLRSEVRAGLQRIERGERVVLAEGAKRTLFATFELSGERPPGFATARALEAADPLEAHRRSYAAWFAANAPRFSSSDTLYDRLLTYRWFLVRHNLAWPAAGNLSGPVVYEGRHGSWYPRVITFSTPHIVAEARWLADPELWSGNVRMHARTQDADGVMRSLLAGWKGAHYTNWIPETVVEACKVRGDRALLADLLPCLVKEVHANSKVFDTDSDGLLAPGDHYATGMEFQPSFWFHQAYDDSKPETQLERIDFTSYHYGNAMAVAEAARLLGDEPERARMEQLATHTRSAVLGKLWSKTDNFFFSARASDDDLARCKEIVGFYPFRFGLVPPTAEYAPALAWLVDEKAFWTPFPPASCSRDVPVFTPHVQQWPGPGGVVTACMWNGPTWPHAISIVADAMARVLRTQAPGPLKPGHLRQLLDRFARFHCEDGDPAKLLLREYGDAESGVNWGCADYMHSTFADLVLRHALGIVPRFDDVLEVRPLQLGFAKLRCEDIAYHGHRVTIEIEGTRLRVWADGKRLGEGSVADGLFLGGALR